MIFRAQIELGKFDKVLSEERKNMNSSPFASPATVSQLCGQIGHFGVIRYFTEVRFIVLSLRRPPYPAALPSAALHSPGRLS